MSRDLSIREFEAAITTYVGCRFLKRKTRQGRSELAFKYTIAANAVLHDYELDSMKAIFRSPKAYIIYGPTGHIVCEIAIDGLYESGQVRQPRGLLLLRRGYPQQTTMLELMAATASKGGKYQRRKGGL